jgi:hypothetical protein
LPQKNSARSNGPPSGQRQLPGFRLISVMRFIVRLHLTCALPRAMMN